MDVRLTLGSGMGIRQSFGTCDFTWWCIYFYKGRMLDALSFRMKRRLAGEFPSSVNGKNVALCSYSCRCIDCICRKYRLCRTACAACRQKIVGNGHRVSLLLASLIAAVMLILQIRSQEIYFHQSRFLWELRCRWLVYRILYT